jgi:hypothetical protein
MEPPDAPAGGNEELAMTATWLVANRLVRESQLLRMGYMQDKVCIVAMRCS